MNAEYDAQRSSDPDAVGDRDYMPKVDGKSFRCHCKCNVFRKLVRDESVFVCNACGEQYASEPLPQPPKGVTT